MRQVAQITPAYTGDVSGVCSALYELGGMIVIHDAAGCGATYSAFDEPRWYSHDGLVFVSGLTENQAILGDDQQLINDTIESAQALQPKFIALVGSPIPMITAVDFPAIARELETATGIPTMGFEATGMHSYIAGAARAFAGLAEKMVREPDTKTPALRLNILGVTPLDFGINGSAQGLRQVFEAQGIPVQAVWAMGASLADIEASANASVNLVVSAAGLKAARVLQQRFDMPYVVGVPYGPQHTAKLIAALQQTLGDRQNRVVGKVQRDPKTVIIGESVTALSLVQALNLPATVLCPVTSDAEILSQGVIKTNSEADLLPYLKAATTIIADPLYQPICPKAARLVPLPHVAFSGNTYQTTMPALITGFEQFQKQFGF
ncbi:MAG: hypothetical protein LKF36_02530 [Lactobacillus sp.]|jgi:nitrogenase molybdenum-iron protein alpha/beta subunit|nr:hypothetical protein [Lactobacillus sp.]